MSFCYLVFWIIDTDNEKPSIFSFLMTTGLPTPLLIGHISWYVHLFSQLWKVFENVAPQTCMRLIFLTRSLIGSINDKIFILTNQQEALMIKSITEYYFCELHLIWPKWQRKWFFVELFIFPCHNNLTCYHQVPQRAYIEHRPSLTKNILRIKTQKHCKFHLTLQPIFEGGNETGSI